MASKTVPRRSRRSRPGRPFGDVAFVVGKEEDGLHILRQRTQDAPLEAGIVKPLAEGRPISGEVISLNRRDDVPYLFDVKTELDVSPRKGRPKPNRKSNRPVTGPLRWPARRTEKAGTRSGADGEPRRRA